MRSNLEKKKWTKGTVSGHARHGGGAGKWGRWVAHTRPAGAGCRWWWGTMGVGCVVND